MGSLTCRFNLLKFCSTVAVALWSMEAEAVSPTLRLVVDAVYDSALGKVSTDNPRWSSEGRETAQVHWIQPPRSGTT